jgi:hypothetical protein
VVDGQGLEVPCDTNRPQPARAEVGRECLHRNVQRRQLEHDVEEELGSRENLDGPVIGVDEGQLSDGPVLAASSYRSVFDSLEDHTHQLLAP